MRRGSGFSARMLVPAEIVVVQMTCAPLSRSKFTAWAAGARASVTDAASAPRIAPRSLLLQMLFIAWSSSGDRQAPGVRRGQSPRRQGRSFGDPGATDNRQN